MKVYINGQEVEAEDENNDSLFGEDVLSLKLPGHLVIDLAAAIKWIGPIEDEDAEMLGRVLRIDTDKLVGKKVRILIEPIGPAKTGR